MPTILLNLPDHGATAEQVAAIQAILPGYRVEVTEDPDRIRPLLPEVEIAGGWPLGEWLERMPRLRWYQQWFAGADWLEEQPGAPAGGAASADFLVTTASGIHAIPIGEHVLALLLAWVRKLPEAVRLQAEHEWRDPPAETMRELYGGTLLVVGAGAIGGRIAELAATLGLRVLAIRHNPDRPVGGAEAVYGPERLLDVLPQADIIVLTAPLTAETRDMVGAPEFNAMKRTAYLVNVGRGGLVRQDALIQALREGQIAGAGLDVFEEEPLPADSPLWDMPNVIITAHYAGVSPHVYERAMALFLDNLKRYSDGQPLRNLVDRRAGY